MPGIVNPRVADIGSVDETAPPQASATMLDAYSLRSLSIKYTRLFLVLYRSKDDGCVPIR